jgi:WD40 repeat protein
VFAKVNRIVFTQQGNKFGVCDGDGNTALWQAASTAVPFFTMQTHGKNTADFVFQGGSSSLLATAGHSADGRNVALWDTLLPQRKACVTAFNCHDAGAACLAHATQHQLLLSAGKKGLVCLWDLRQGRLLHTFRAHEHAVKCIAMDSNETMFVTGSADGDIKVWDLTSQRAIQSYPQEHSRHGLFKNISQGVAQVSLDDGTLYSCGADGSMKMRRLPERDVYVNVRDF